MGWGPALIKGGGNIRDLLAAAKASLWLALGTSL